MRTHPETGRRNLFVNPGFTREIKGLTARRAMPCSVLYAHMATPEYIVRYRWEAGDLGFWDNRTTMHYAISDYGDAHRVTQRVTMQGDKRSRPPEHRTPDRAPPPCGPAAALPHADTGITTHAASSSAHPDSGAQRRPPHRPAPPPPHSGPRFSSCAPRRLVLAPRVPSLSLDQGHGDAQAGVTLTFADQLKEYQTILHGHQRPRRGGSTR